MAVILNSSTAGELNPGLGGSRSPVATAIGVVRRTSINTSLGDALSAQVTYGWDLVTGEARIVLPSPTGGIGETVTLSMGAGNNADRFHGTIVEFDTRLFPHSVTALCKGPLYDLEKFEIGTESTDADGFTKPGLAFEDLVQTLNGATLQQIVTAVLNLVGVSYSLGNFEDPGHVYGLIDFGKDGASDHFLWGTHETAAQYLGRILEASAGYRLVDSVDGNVYLKQITALPGDSSGLPGTTDLTFVLGEDIFGDSSSVTSSIGRKDAVLVEGYDPGDGGGPATSHVVGNGSSAFRISSPLIETDAFATEIANFWLPQVSRDQRVVRLVTPRDDLIGPAATVFVDAANGLGVSETMWVKSVTAEVAESGEFTQHLVCVASVA